MPLEGIVTSLLSEIEVLIQPLFSLSPRSRFRVFVRGGLIRHGQWDSSGV